MTFLGSHQLHGGVYVFFYKVSFEKHPSEHTCCFSQCFLSAGQVSSVKSEILKVDW